MPSTASPADVEVPLNKITVKDGVVIKFESWLNWNGTVHRCILIYREADRFACDVTDLEHGGWNGAGTLEEALLGFHPIVAGGYRRLFELTEPTSDSIRNAGFQRHELVHI